MIKPMALQPGDTAMMIAPSSPADIDKVYRMKEKLERMNIHVLVGRSVFEKRTYLAGSDPVRLHDIHEAFLNPRIKAVFCARGGYGSARLLPFIDYSLISRNPKIFWGYSDITALHIAFTQLAGLVTFHGPMMQECGSDDVDEVTMQSFDQLFSPQSLAITAAEPHAYPSFSRSISAPVVGGNLTVLTSTLGSLYEIDTRGKILLLEDIGEEPYRIDRMLNQLRLAGKLQHAAGIILGDFHDCEPKKRTDSLSIQEIVYDHIVPFGIPVMSGFPIGHGKPNRGIPIGAYITMDGTDGTITFEPGVQ